MRQVLGYNLTDRDEALVMAIYAKLGLNGALKLLSTIKRSNSGPTLTSHIIEQTMEQFKETPLLNLKLRRSALLYSLITGMQERPDLAGKDLSNLAKAFAAAKVVDDIPGSRVQFSDVDLKSTIDSAHQASLASFRQAENARLTKILEKEFDKALKSQPIKVKAPCKSDLTKAEWKEVKSLAKSQGRSAHFGNKDLIKETIDKRGQGSIPASTKSTFDPQTPDYKSSILMGTLFGMGQGLYHAYGSGSGIFYLNSMFKGAAQGAAGGALMTGTKHVVGKTVARAVSGHVFSETGKQLLDGSVGLAAGVVVEGMYGLYTGFNTGDWARAGKNFGKGATIGTLSAGAGTGAAFLVFGTNPVGWALAGSVAVYIAVAGGVSFACNKTCDYMEWGTGPTLQECRKKLEDKASEFMAQYPGTHIDVASLSDDAIKTMNLDAPGFDFKFTPEYISAVEDHFKNGNAIPSEFRDTFEHMERMTHTSPKIIPPQPSVNPLNDYMVQLVYVPIIIQASRFNSLNITRGLELYYHSLA